MAWDKTGRRPMRGREHMVITSALVLIAGALSRDLGNRGGGRPGDRRAGNPIPGRCDHRNRAGTEVLAGEARLHRRRAIDAHIQFYLSPAVWWKKP